MLSCVSELCCLLVLFVVRMCVCVLGGFVLFRCVVCLFVVWVFVFSCVFSLYIYIYMCVVGFPYLCCCCVGC